MAKAVQNGNAELKEIGKVGQLRVVTYDTEPLLELPIGKSGVFRIGVRKCLAFLACLDTVKAFLAQYGQPKAPAPTIVQADEMSRLRAEIAALKGAKAGRVDAIAA